MSKSSHSDSRDEYAKRKVAYGMGGAALAAYGLTWAPLWLKVPCLLAGGALIYKAASSTQEAHMSRADLPRTEPRPYGDGTRDVVDEASWESFPASDPPGY